MSVSRRRKTRALRLELEAGPTHVQALVAELVLVLELRRQRALACAVEQKDEVVAMLDLKDVEFAGPFGRAIVRLGGSFHSLVWRDGAGGIAAKLYPAYDRNGEAQAIADAIKCVHHNVPPAPGARSMRKITRRGLAPVVV